MLYEFRATVSPEQHYDVPEVVGSATNVSEFLSGAFMDQSYCGPLYGVHTVNEDGSLSFVMFVRRGYTQPVPA